MHDAITAEKAGIPATAIITDRFSQTARVMAQVAGMPEYPFAVIAHPISNNDPETLRAKADESARQAARILLER